MAAHFTTGPTSWLSDGIGGTIKSKVNIRGKGGLAMSKGVTMLSVHKPGDDEGGVEERPGQGRNPTPEEFAATMGRSDTPNAQIAIGLARFVATVMGKKKGEARHAGPGRSGLLLGTKQVATT
jgi:hypothetical protein